MSTTSSDNSITSEHSDLVFADILSQAITGELIGMLNFATLVDLYDDVIDKMEAVEHANSERTHAIAFQKAAADLRVPVLIDLDAPYWSRIRAAFLRWAANRDLTACVIIQELMLESFAVSLYHEVSRAAKGQLAVTFRAIGQEEEPHLEHAIQLLQKQRASDEQSFDTKMAEIHEDVMTVLAEMVAKEDPRGHCGLCRGECVKHSLGGVNLNISTMRGKALNQYLTSLDRIGLPGEETLKWIANLPV